MSIIVWHFMLYIYYNNTFNMKKIFLFLFMFIVLTSCGAKNIESPVIEGWVMNWPAEPEATNF